MILPPVRWSTVRRACHRAWAQPFGSLCLLSRAVSSTTGIIATKLEFVIIETARMVALWLAGADL